MQPHRTLPRRSRPTTVRLSHRSRFLAFLILGVLLPRQRFTIYVDVDRFTEAFKVIVGQSSFGVIKEAKNFSLAFEPWYGSSHHDLVMKPLHPRPVVRKLIAIRCPRIVTIVSCPLSLRVEAALPHSRRVEGGGHLP